MELPNVYYYGEHAVTFTVNGITKHSWNDWGLIPSSRFSEPIRNIWRQEQTITGINGQEDLLRLFPLHTVVNSYSNLKTALKNDNQDYIKSHNGYDIFQGSAGSLSFIIADQEHSFSSKIQEITNFLHNQNGTMKFTDDPYKTYTVRFAVSSASIGDNYSNLSVSYTVISE